MSTRSAKPTTGELSEPTVSAARVPVWLLVLLAVLGYWGLRYLDQRAGGFHAQVYQPYASHAAMRQMLPKLEGDPLFASGQRAFGIYCSVCHQGTGQGMAGQFPPLAGSEWVLASGPNRIIRLVLDGIQGPITVKNTAFNGAMPPWRDLLKDEEIAAVITYIRQNKSWTHNAPAVAAEQVRSLREKTAGRAGNAWSPDELLQIPEGQ